jgi:hypothetical protein
VEYTIMSSVSNGTNGYSHASGHTAPNVVNLPTAKVIDPTDVQMDQIRDLLFGEFKREIDHRMAAFETRIVDLERRLAAARSEDETKRKSMLDDIARGVAALGDHVKQISR